MNDAILRKGLDIYRIVLNKIAGRSTDGVMPFGIPCNVEPFIPEKYHGDVVHPCIRYIEEGYEGIKWWLVYTPYYNADASIENPILCYSDSQDSVPPIEWKVYCLVNEKPEDGYNSDPNLLYHNGQLYVYWRENVVTNKEKYSCSRATFCGKVANGSVEKMKEPVLIASIEHEDTECCPTFMPDTRWGG